MFHGGRISMSRINYKDFELKKMAEIIQSSEDRREMMQKLNGYRMGLTNKYRTNSDLDVGQLTKFKRLKAWSDLIRMYK